MAGPNNLRGGRNEASASSDEIGERVARHVMDAVTAAGASAAAVAGDSAVRLTGVRVEATCTYTYTNTYTCTRVIEVDPGDVSQEIATTVQAQEESPESNKIPLEPSEPASKASEATSESEETPLEPGSNPELPDPEDDIQPNKPPTKGKEKRPRAKNKENLQTIRGICEDLYKEKKEKETDEEKVTFTAKEIREKLSSRASKIGPTNIRRYLPLLVEGGWLEVVEHGRPNGPQDPRPAVYRWLGDPAARSNPEPEPGPELEEVPTKATPAEEPDTKSETDNLPVVTEIGNDGSSLDHVAKNVEAATAPVVAAAADTPATETESKETPESDFLAALEQAVNASDKEVPFGVKSELVKIIAENLTTELMDDGIVQMLAERPDKTEFSRQETRQIRFFLRELAKNNNDDSALLTKRADDDGHEFFTPNLKLFELDDPKI
ncbi:hypothetical protein FWH58_03730 [Candidatus Saccharibacteria bacterium]|nr:hypothetical protein [Candidatus Saccharibacteria bacterium]